MILGGGGLGGGYNAEWNKIVGKEGSGSFFSPHQGLRNALREKKEVEACCLEIWSEEERE